MVSYASVSNSSLGDEHLFQFLGTGPTRRRRSAVNNLSPLAARWRGSLPADQSDRLTKEVFYLRHRGCHA